jgi:exopolysaccharide production protein ExoZ
MIKSNNPKVIVKDYAINIEQKKELMPSRLHNLDYLRGLVAFGIMIYHYLIFSFGEFTADTFIGRIGIYGVSIFYVLSGLTLYYVYFNNIKPTKQEVFSFFKKRIFRIFPLLWLVTIAAIILSSKAPDFYNLFLNLTGLFGFIKWDTYFSDGVWSIGNELVFYVFFPFFILFSKSNKFLMIILSLILFSFYLYFSFVILSPEQTLAQQWREYVNPLNQAFLFLGGFLIGLLLNTIKISRIISILLLLFSIGLFIIIPSNGNLINLVTGVNRLIFTFCCFLICFSFYKLNFKLPAFINKPLALLGEASYSIYLLHPIIYKITGGQDLNNHPSIKISLSIILTLIISYLTYEYFEKFFMKLAKRT